MVSSTPRYGSQRAHQKPNPQPPRELRLATSMAGQGSRTGSSRATQAREPAARGDTPNDRRAFPGRSRPKPELRGQGRCTDAVSISGGRSAQRGLKQNQYRNRAPGGEHLAVKTGKRGFRPSAPKKHAGKYASRRRTPAPIEISGARGSSF